MLSSIRVGVPADRTFKSTVPKRQATLITPKRLIRRNNTYGKNNSSLKKSTHTRIWGWQNFINDESVEEEQDLPCTLHNGGDERETQQSNKRENDNAINNNYIRSQKKKRLRRKPANELDADQIEPLDTKVEVWNGDNTLGKAIREESLQDKNFDFSKELQNGFRVEQDSVSFPKTTHPLNNDKNPPRLPKSLDVLSPIWIQRNISPPPMPQTPKPFSTLEVPSSQSPATPISLSSRGTAIFRGTVKESNNKPIPFKLQENRSYSPEVMDTFDLDISVSLADCDAQKGAIDKYLSLGIMGGLNPGTEFKPMSCVHTSPIKLLSPSKPVKFVLPDEQEKDVQVPSSPFVSKKSKSTPSSGNSVFQMKTEILDSEAESDEEIDASKEIFSNRKPVYPKIHMDISQNRFTSGHQDSLSQKSSEQTKLETYYGETLGSETRLELENFSAPRQISEASYEDTHLPKSEKANISSKTSDKKEYLYEETQNVETMRLSTQNFAQIAPRTSESDIFMSIDPQRVTEILNGVRDHETRRYKLPPPVCRVWLYERNPVCAVKYMAEISPAKCPGEIINEIGVGNREFNSRKSTSSWSAYEILQVYELSDPLTLDDLKSKEWLKRAPMPMRWTKIPPAVADELVANLKKPVFENSMCSIARVSPSGNNCDSNYETLSDNGQSIHLGSSSTIDLSPSNNDDGIEVNRYTQHTKFEFKKEYPSSQATTVDLSPANTPRQESIERISETPTKLDITSTSAILPSPQHIELPRYVDQQRRIPFSIASSQLLTESQLLPESLLNDCTLMPESILLSSEDYLIN